MCMCAQDELEAIKDPEQWHRKLVELNVMEQCLNVFKTGPVQQARKASLENGSNAWPRVHGFVFNPSDGILRRLPIDFRARTSKLNGLYDLY